ncbi:ribosomal protein S18 [Polytolypa hystricis UAMH7299]|uniref:Small ribosomal subunit protein bS18m n=1 Tax=Polytolypa hystricis (strain UAMH7299) TaxID=1447883 RepID=A0A2B7XQH6_POLH7|nr:ribosomal protein S18 [Polytolypa hystricis UAMH7299]
MASMLGSVRSLTRSVIPEAGSQPAVCRWNSTWSMAQERRIRGAETRLAARKKFVEQAIQQEKIKVLEKSQTREWKTGDIYAPHDLSAAEMKKWKKRQSPSTDAFDALSMNPLHQYKNFSIMSEYMSEMGRIRHSSETGLRPVNQRKIAKAIRRAIGLGLMPSVHKHPEILLAAARLKIQRGYAA